MAEISNKTLGLLLVVAIVFSVGGAMISLSKLSELTTLFPLLQVTGMGTKGTVNITIASSVAINVTEYEIEFGPGYVSVGSTAARLNTSDGVKGKENWTNATGYVFLPSNLTIENVGNRNLSLNFTSDKPASSFIGGSSPNPSFMFRGVNKDGGTCDTVLNLTTSYTEVTNAQANEVCKCMRFEDVNDEIFVNVQVLIPQNAPVGQKNATLTFAGSDWGGLNKAC